MPPHDFYVPLMSLPACLQLDASQVEGEPYLVPPGECPPHIAALLSHDDRPTVALRWQGNPPHSNDRRRSIGGALLAPLLDIPGVRFVAMQKHPPVRELLSIALQQKVVDVGSACADFEDSAHAMRRVDLVVTVDTAVAHLAGATGAPTLLLPAVHTGLSVGADPYQHAVVPKRDHPPSARGLRLGRGPRRRVHARDGVGEAVAPLRPSAAVTRRTRDVRRAA
jgi:hypothetical protein